jgi:predicted nucleotidyltransferase
MTVTSVESIVRALNSAGVRYLIVGGLAVVAHGYVRFTADIDLVLDPDPRSLKRALRALGDLGYRPRAPVPLEDFADVEKRAAWARDKGLTVFSLHSDDHAATEIDLFVEPPFDFEKAYGRVHRADLGSGVEASFAGLEDLIEIKRSAGRAQDIEDLDALRSLGGKR